MQQLTLFWFDMTLVTSHAEPDPIFLDHFDIRHLPSPNLLDEYPEPGTAICFEFDYPDRPGLSLLCRVKERYPQYPIFMLTTHHSEGLAVWAYRNRVLDYLVSPVSREDVLRCQKLLLAIKTADNRQGSREIISYNSKIPTEVPTGQRIGNIRLAPAVHFVQRNFRRQFRNAEVAELCGMSTFHFSRAFTEAFALTFQEFVLRFRIFEACKELQHPNVPVANVAYSVGFNDPSYFARVFRRYIGMSPTEYCEASGREGFDRRVKDILTSIDLPEFQPRSVERRRTTDRPDADVASRR